MTLRRFNVLIEWDPEEQVWVTNVPTLNHLSTYGETRKEALENTKEAILGYFEAAAKERLPLPRDDVRAEWVKIEVPVP